MPVELGPWSTYVEKTLSRRERDEPEARLRLRSEATLLAALAPLRVTPSLLAHGEDERGPWHRVERLAIPTLAERLAERCAALEPAWVERAVRAAFSSLARIHEAEDACGPLGVVHADLSPANVALDEEASAAIILDFDLAWWRDGPPRADGAFRGTIAYVAPEVARGEPPTPASDLFALAATLLHAATGAPPRDGPSFAALLAMAAEVPILVPGGFSARGPGHDALAACLAPDPAARPSSARTVLRLASQ